MKLYTITQQTEKGVLYWNAFLETWVPEVIKLMEWRANEQFKKLEKNFPQLKIDCNEVKQFEFENKAQINCITFVNTKYKK